MKLTIYTLLIAIAGATSAAAEPVSAFPLLGLWKVIGATAAGEVQKAGEGEQMEFLFLPEGVLTVTAISPVKNITKPVRMQFRYTFFPPDVVTYTLDGTITERQRFILAGDILSFDNLDYKITSTLRRIKTTEFTEPFKEIDKFPK